MYEIEICLFCGSKKTHIRKRCPVRSAACYRCQKIGHYAKVCRSPAKEAPSNTSACITPALCAIQQAPECLRFAVVVVVFVHGKQLPALMDPGSSLSDVSEKLLNRCICPFDSNNIYYEKHVDLVECSLSRNTYITYDYDVRPSNLWVIAYVALGRKSLETLAYCVNQCFSTFLLQRNLEQMFALLVEPYVIIQVSILLQRIELWLLISSQAISIPFGGTPGSHSRNPGWKTLVWTIVAHLGPGYRCQRSAIFVLVTVTWDIFFVM